MKILMNSELDDKRLREIIILMHDTEMEFLPEDKYILGKYKLSDKFYMQMNRLIKKVNYKKRIKEILRYAVACVAVIVILFVAARPNMVAEAARKFIIWMESLVTFQFEEKTEIDSFPEYELTYVPERYKLEHQIYSAEDYIGDILYYSNDGMMDFGYMRSDASEAVNGENVEIEIIDYNEERKIYYIKSNDEQYNSSMIWKSGDGKITYTLSGDLSKKEFFKIIDGIKVK